MYKNFIICLLIAFVACSCEQIEDWKTEWKTERYNNHIEKQLLSLQKDELISYFETALYHYFNFSSQKEQIKIEKSLISSVSNSLRTLTVNFTDGEKAVFNYQSWLDVSLETDRANFYFDCDTAVVRFTINDTDNPVSVSLVDADKTVSSTVTYDRDGKGGAIFMRVISSQNDFTEDAIVRFDNGEKTIDIPFTLTKEYFFFNDGTTAKSFEFMEFANTVHLMLSKVDETTEVIIPQDVDWIDIQISKERKEKKDYTDVRFFIDDNNDISRSATVTITNENHHSLLTVSFSQLGVNEKGSVRRGLIALYNAVGGDNWGFDYRFNRPFNENWCSDKPIWEWDGIIAYDGTYTHTDSTGKPKSYFSYNPVNKNYFGLWFSFANELKEPGEIPEEFWEIVPNFSSIDISGNRWKGTLPDYIWEQTQLTKLNLSGNDIAGELQDSFYQMTNLFEFDIFSTDITGTLTSDFYKMTNLRIFDIGGTKIGGTLSPEIANLTKLQLFDIYDCEFEGTIPEEFGLLSELTGWDFGGNYFTNVPQFLRYRHDTHIFNLGTVSLNEAFQYDKEKGKRAGWVSLPFPMWARIRYGFVNWFSYNDNDVKRPQYPYFDDLQYPVNEYFFDGKDWRHPKLEYPAREYWFDGENWLHDASCPWDEEYIDPRYN